MSIHDTIDSLLGDQKDDDELRELAEHFLHYRAEFYVRAGMDANDAAEKAYQDAMDELPAIIAEYEGAA